MKVLDVGAGPGIYVDAMRSLGIEADGVDVDELTPCHKCDVFSAEFERRYFHTDYDLVMSIEMAEHLPAERAHEFVWRLASVGAPTILFTAAFPGQGGLGHINCQPQQYWREKFAHYGYVYDPEATANIIRHVTRSGTTYMGWFKSNAQVFRKKTSYGSAMYDTIIREETPQAQSIASFLVQFPNF